MKKKSLIRVIYGIGNEGDDFLWTRHNIGKEIILNYMKNPKKNKFSIYDIFNNFILGTNNNFVNNSGLGAKELILKFKVKPENFLVIHDDADILFPFFKISFGVSSAGHKGVDSIIRSLKTNRFWRLRIGIQKKNRQKAEEIVLKKWSKNEKIIIKNLFKKFKIIFDILKERMPNELNLSKDYFFK